MLTSACSRCTKAETGRFPRDTSIPRMNSRLKSTIRPVLATGCSSASISNCSRRPISDKSMETRSTVRPTANYTPRAIWRLQNVQRRRYYYKPWAYPRAQASGYDLAGSIMFWFILIECYGELWYYHSIVSDRLTIQTFCNNSSIIDSVPMFFFFFKSTFLYLINATFNLSGKYILVILMRHLHS